jgi:hypothetical protein
LTKILEVIEKYNISEKKIFLISEDEEFEKL